VNAFITGIGWVTATDMGCGRDKNRFELKAGKLPDISRKEAFDTPYPKFRRLDRYSRLGLSAIAFALKDAGLDRWTDRRPISIIASTVHGCLETDLNYYDTVIPEDGCLASPNLFAYTLSNTYLGEAAIRFGLTGATYVISESTLSELWCLRMALTGMAGGQFDKALGGRCDLGHCAPYSESERTAGGALFFVIEKKTSNACRVYGDVGLDSRGALFFNGTWIKDLVTLARHCIAAYSNKK
jgi:3-oxoacyl-[acyl-carrier-protein] synthase II